MSAKLEIFKCGVCGNIVQLLHSGGGILVCCNKQMNLVTENSVEASVEKHKPVIVKTEKGIKVSVGSVPHPMEEKHYIEWIQIVDKDYVYCKYLKPGALPEAEFCIKYNDEIYANEYCNLHGLWRN